MARTFVSIGPWRLVRSVLASLAIKSTAWAGRNHDIRTCIIDTQGRQTGNCNFPFPHINICVYTHMCVYIYIYTHHHDDGAEVCSAIRFHCKQHRLTRRTYSWGPTSGLSYRTGSTWQPIAGDFRYRTRPSQRNRATACCCSPPDGWSTL